MKKRLLAMIMAFVMAMSLLPMSALAAASDLAEGQVKATKTLTDNEDETYTINLTVQGKPKQTTTGSNADVVLVVDNSGSMGSSVGKICNTPKEEFTKERTTLWYRYTCPNCGARYSSSLGGLLWDTRPNNCTGQVGSIVRIEAAKDVSKEFASSILASGSGNQLAVIGFAHKNKDGGANDTGAIKVYQGLTTDLSAINSKIDTMVADGGTNYTAALKKAYDCLSARSNKSRPGYVIFISDGAPGRSGESLNNSNWNGSNQIAALKEAGITVYTVGIALEDDAANYLKNMASDVKDKHFINVTGTDYNKQLSDILKTWANQINTIPAGRNAVLTDIVDTSKFEIIAYDTEKLGLAADGKTFTWNIGDITENEQTAWIKIKANDGVYGENIPTNKNVYLDYTDTDGKPAKKVEAEIGRPTVSIEEPVTYTVSYSWTGLPEGATVSVPTDAKAYYAGDAVTIDDTFTSTTTTKVGHDTYTFSGWTSVEPELTDGKMPASNVTVSGSWSKTATDPTYTVSYSWTGLPEGATVTKPADVTGVYAGEAVSIDNTFTSSTTTKVGDDTYIFSGWTVNPELSDGKMPAQDVVVSGTWYLDNWNDREDKATGGDGIPDKYQALVLFKSKDTNKGTVTGDGIVQVFTFSKQEGDTIVYLEKGTVDPDMTNVTATAKSGYKFSIWTKDNGTTSVNPDTAINDVAGGTIIEFYANWTKKSSPKPPVLNKEDHYAYVVGYPDGTVKPQGNITRAEVATIFFRMLTDESRNEFWSQTNSYSDVSEGQWFNNAISTLANAGILSGYPDGTFRPNAPITRAEFTKIAASFFEQVEYTIDNPFTDVNESDWFYKFVMAAYEDGLITGYPEGDFRPNANINRAEAMTIVNRTLGRAPDADHFLKDMIVWPDNPKSAWYYEAVQEATNSHEYVMKGTGTNQYEEWTKILEVRDWPALEKEWSDANSAAGGEVVK